MPRKFSSDEEKKAYEKARWERRQGPKDHPCECGCGGMARAKQRFIHGHHASKGGLTRFVIRDCGYETPCHIWTGALDRDGYGKCTLDQNRSARPHRVLFERKYGPIPDGLMPDHLCRNRRCICVDHIQLVTNAENIRRGIGCKLTAQEVIAIRYAYAQTAHLPERAPGKITHAALAKQYGVTPPHISDIINRKKWAVDMPQN